MIYLKAQLWLWKTISYPCLQKFDLSLWEKPQYPNKGREGPLHASRDKFVDAREYLPSFEPQTPPIWKERRTA